MTKPGRAPGLARRTLFCKDARRGAGGMDRLDTAAPTPTFAPGATGHLARLFAMSPDLLAAAGFDGLLKLFNDAWEQQLGFTREELQAKPYLELVHEDDRAETEAEIAKVAR